MIATDLWAEYARTVVEIIVPGQAPFQIHPAPAGHVGRWPAPFTAPVHMLTAWDPGDERPGEAENRRQQAALERELEARGVAVWPTVGRDLETHHREEGVAVAGLDALAALDLARRFRQNAIFSWTPETWSVLSCLDDARHDAGWRVEPLEP